MNEFENVTTEDAVAKYKATNNIFRGLFKEVRELSKKKPDATLSAGKVKLINRALKDLKDFLKKEPEGKFLDLLDDSILPQTSDAVLIMVQFETVLGAYNDRYFKTVKWNSGSRSREWITPEFIRGYKELNE